MYLIQSVYAAVLHEKVRVLDGLAATVQGLPGQGKGAGGIIPSVSGGGPGGVGCDDTILGFDILVDEGAELEAERAKEANKRSKRAERWR